MCLIWNLVKFCLPHSSMNMELFNFISFFSIKSYLGSVTQSKVDMLTRLRCITHSLYMTAYFTCVRENGLTFHFLYFHEFLNNYYSYYCSPQLHLPPSIRGKCSITNSYDLPTVPGILIRILWETTVCFLRDCTLLQKPHYANYTVLEFSY